MLQPHVSNTHIMDVVHASYNHKGYEPVLYSTSRVRILVYVDSFEMVSQAAVVVYRQGFVCFLVCEYFPFESD